MKLIAFTGHRSISKSAVEPLKMALRATLNELIQHGAMNFNVGGANGFDTIAAQTVLELKRNNLKINLHLVLPCCREDQTANWKLEDIEKYDRIFAFADSVEYISNKYYDGCMRARNARLIAIADCCICYFNPQKYASGTGQTIRLANRKGIPVINIMDKLEN